MAGFIERDQWKNFLEGFSQRNHPRPTRLEVVGEVGDQDEEQFLPLLGVNLETKVLTASSVEIILAAKQLPIAAPGTRDQRRR